MPGDAAINSFWAWFVANSDRFRTMETPAKEGLLDEIVEKLHTIDDRLYFEVSEPQEGGNELVITAEGDRELFPLVDKMVALAPRLKGWKFTALRPAMGFGFAVEYSGVKLDPDELWFLPLTAGDDEEHLGLRIGIPRLSPKSTQAAVNAAWILLDTALGERRTAETIAHVEVARLPWNPEEAGYIALVELPDYLQWRESEGLGGAT